ncbi:MAG: helix-turn-helix transcriptional regulator [Hyphomonas sp.]|nr:helix-turn-helix transcriptional regulator [Hyphomonas sp.]MCB9961395.1 helix-turn-helix transcriptional regulator [Hyphomonas sp.]MCB9971570.1 helix-turn-helix transcriptional regulator [Hyphomonas sp.]
MQYDRDFVYDLEVRVIDLESKVERLEDAIRKAMSGVKHADFDLPDDVMDRIRKGEHPVRVIRLHRLMTQKQLSEICGIRSNHISAIERGMDFGLKSARRLASALRVPVDLIQGTEVKG